MEANAEAIMRIMMKMAVMNSRVMLRMNDGNDDLDDYDDDDDDNDDDDNVPEYSAGNRSGVSVRKAEVKDVKRYTQC